MIRGCFECGAEINECMGFVLARDLLPVLEGKIIFPTIIRERCGKCAEKRLVDKLKAQAKTPASPAEN